MSDPSALVRSVRREIVTVAKEAVIYDSALMEERLALLIAPERTRALLFGAFAATAVGLASVGLYGLLAYSVERNLCEFGLRIALGSSQTRLLGLVVWRGVWPALLGLAIGLSAATVVTRVLSGILYGLSPTDPMTYFATALAMMTIALLASCLAARRAIRADPISILKDQ